MSCVLKSKKIANAKLKLWNEFLVADSFRGGLVIEGGGGLEILWKAFWLFYNN